MNQDTYTSYDRTNANYGQYETNKLNTVQAYFSWVHDESFNISFAVSSDKIDNDIIVQFYDFRQSLIYESDPTAIIKNNTTVTLSINAELSAELFNAGIYYAKVIAKTDNSYTVLIDLADCLLQVK